MWGVIPVDNANIRRACAIFVKFFRIVLRIIVKFRFVWQFFEYYPSTALKPATGLSFRVSKGAKDSADKGLDGFYVKSL